MSAGSAFMIWWGQRATRERYVLMSAALLLALLIVYLLLEPLLLQRRQLESDMPRLREDLVWMQAQLEELDALRAGNGISSSATGVLSIALVEQLLVDAGIRDQVTDLRPVQGQSVMVRFNQVTHARLMGFLLLVRQHAAAHVSLASIRRLQDQTGNVEASLTLSPDVAP